MVYCAGTFSFSTHILQKKCIDTFKVCKQVEDKSVESVYFCMEDHSMSFINQTSESLRKSAKNQRINKFHTSPTQWNARNMHFLEVYSGFQARVCKTLLNSGFQAKLGTTFLVLAWLISLSACSNEYDTHLGSLPNCIVNWSHWNHWIWSQDQREYNRRSDFF